ncbi:MAG TPA: aldose epimerase family protein [Planctomycetaceae bacterium]|jgi:aldose 1-epimerase|nr:aldose epimerase family protein [Planctomycetaceae bacterium]
MVYALAARVPAASRLRGFRGAILMQRLRPGIVLVFVAALAGCETNAPPAPTPVKKSSEADAHPPEPHVRIQSEPFGDSKDGLPITRYLLSNDRGMAVSIIDYGAAVTEIDFPDRNKKTANITLGFPTVDGYLSSKQPYFGPICGRYANRIAKGKFKLNGKEYTLAINDPPNTLHGGVKSFSHVVWHSKPVTPPSDGKSAGVELMYESRDGEEGYPGAVKTTVIYTLTDTNELRIDYRAVSAAPTVINLTSHIYWNLHGAGTREVLDHTLMLNADRFLPVDDTLIPTGELKPVKGSAMDFLSPTKIGARLKEVDGGGGLKGYDHCYALNERKDPLKEVAVRVEDPESGRVLEILTTEPGVQFYTGNQLSGKPDDGGFKPYTGLCLECQHYPDSPNRPSFPSTLLDPNKPYTQTTIYRFSVK